MPTRISALFLLLLLPLSSAAAQIPGLQDEPAGDEPDAGAPVAARTDPEADAAVERFLEQVYATVEGLEGIEVEVQAGVVDLSGEVLSEASRRQAERIARQVEGVVEVEDDVVVVRDVERRLASTLERLHGKALDFTAALPILAVALAVFLLFWFLGAWLAGRRQPFERLAPNRFLRDLTRGGVRAAVVLVGALLALQILDATALVAAIAGAAGIAGLALGFAFRDLAENFIASVLLSLRQPFLPNDHVVIADHEGRVVRLTSRATVLITLDGNHVRIPNAQVFKGVILNYSRNPRRRFDFVVGVGVDSDLAAAQELGMATLAAMDGVLDEPPPQSWIDELGDSNVSLHFFAWIDQRHSEWAKARSEAVRRVKEAFDAAGFDMPEPIYRLKLIERREEPPADAAASGERPEPQRPALDVPAETPSDAVTDISRDTWLDREVDQERRQEGDLLDPEAPVE